MTLTLIFILFIVSTLLILYKKIKSGLSLLIATCIVSYSIGSGALPSFLLQKAQTPYAQNPNIVWQKSNAIVMLGAGTVKISSTDSVIPSFMSYSRILKTAELYLECKKTRQQCKVVLSGGDAFRTGVPEAVNYSETLSKLGVNQNDMLLEKNSLNTYQNAEFTSHILKEKQFDQIFLVTSGIHLKRALLYFSHFDIYPEPIIADYINARFTILPIAYNFTMTDFVLHEYIGIWRFYIYNFLGWNK